MSKPMNLDNLLVMLTCLSYLTATVIQSLRLIPMGIYHRNRSSFWVIAFGVLAFCFQTILLYHWIDLGVDVGQNLTFLNLTAQISWLICLFLLILSYYYQSCINLSVIIFPMAAFSVFFAWLAPSYNIIDTWANPKAFLHIILALLAYSVFGIAATQALLLYLQNWLLRRHRLASVLRSLPPLETVERLLFRLIIFGFILLTMLVMSSFISFPSLLFEGTHLQHTLLALAAWAVFAILLLGRIALGWRGHIAINWTIGGMLLLFLSYFGSSLLLSSV